jgi:hypothetical protein
MSDEEKGKYTIRINGDIITSANTEDEVWDIIKRYRPGTRYEVTYTETGGFVTKFIPF